MKHFNFFFLGKKKEQRLQKFVRGAGTIVETTTGSRSTYVAC